MKKVSYIDSNLFSPKDAWDALSMAEKSEMMKVAVQNGITNLDDIRREYNEFAEGGYMNKAKALIKKNEGWMSKPYKDAPEGKSWRSVGYGFNDSGFYDKYPEGISRHYENGITKAQAEQELNYVLNKADKHLRSIYGKQWDSFNDNQKAAIMDTYYQRPASVGKKSAFYNAVKSGKDASKYLGVKGFADRNKKRQSVFGGGAVPMIADNIDTSLPQEVALQPIVENIPEFIPLNPQAFNTTLPTYQRPELTFEEPVVQETPVSPYSPEEIERQERAEGLANLGRFLSFTNTSGSNNAFLNTIGMLTGNTFAEGGDTNDNDLVDWIIREEGFNSKPENIGDGKITLGSGLTDKKWHDLYRKRGNKWSAEDNRMAVAEEVANRRRWAEKNIPNWDTLPDSAQKALLSYKYNYNFTSANSPKLFQALADSNLYEAAKQMDATSKDPKFKKGLMDRRKREQEWFLSDIADNAAPTQAIPVQTPTTIGISMPSITEPAVSTAVRNNYVPATTTPYNRGNNMRRAFESAVAFNRMMDATSLQNNPLPEYQFPISYADGGDLNYSYTKPLNNVFLDDEGNLLDPEVPSAKGTIRTPEVVIATRDPRKAVPTANGLNIPDVSLELKRRFYDHITPAGYEFPITRTVAAVLNPGRVKTIEVNPQIRRGKTIYPGLIRALRDDLFAEYLQIPKEERHKVIINSEDSAYNSGEIEETSLRPTNAENDKYFKFKNLSKLERDRLVRLGTPLSVGSNTLSKALGTYLGEHTIGHGHDTKGDYVSYYDNWDLAPFTGKGEDQSLGIGKPVHIYDRIYLDDYYGLPEEYRGSTYIPELTVTANKHADGGKIHIDPSKKGTFTAAASKHGMGVQEFASKVLANKEDYSPAMVKKANFARNASKWHGFGGNLFEEGGNQSRPPIIPFSQRAEVIITPDSEYNKYLNTLPDNQRFTPNDKYDSYLYWKLNGKPNNFKEAYDKEMFTYDNSDKSYHANSVAWDNDNDIGYFMKPKDHDTVKYELDWFNKGLVTEEGGWQRPETLAEWKESKDFRNNYELVDDPSRPNFYRYQPKKRGFGGNLYEDGGSYSYTKPLDNVFVDEYGNLLDPNVPSARGTVQLPEVIATTRDPRKYSSAYDKYLGFGDALYDLSRNVMLRGHSWGIGDGTEKISLPSDSISNEPFEGIAQATYLLPRDIQDTKFKDAGYTRSDRDYGLVKRAVGSNNVPVYQKRPDDISRDKLVPIGNINDIWLGKEEAELVHPGSYPTTIYIDPETNDLYQKGWDYNNYGSSDSGGGAAKYYSGLKKYAADALDMIGSPVVVTTGFSRIGNINNLDDYSKMTLNDYGILDSYRKKNTSSNNIRKQKHGPSK